MSSKFNLKKTGGTFLLGTAIAGIAGSSMSMASGGELKRKLGELSKESIASRFNQAKDFLGSKFSNAGEYISDKFSNAGKYMSDKFSGVSNYMSSKFPGAMNLAKAHPYAAAAIGVGVLALTVSVIVWACSRNSDQVTGYTYLSGYDSEQRNKKDNKIDGAK